jgi:hypothetical protein
MRNHKGQTRNDENIQVDRLGSCRRVDGAKLLEKLKYSHEVDRENTAITLERRQNILKNGKKRTYRDFWNISKGRSVIKDF